MSLKHRKVVNVADDPAAAAKLRPSDWGSPSTNYDTAPTHVFDGGALGALAMRDTTSAEGYSWLPSEAGVLVSDGDDEVPAFRALLAADIPALPYAPSDLTGLIVDGDIVSIAWGKITGTPTTIGGYGITDFNSLGDARWDALGAAATVAGNLAAHAALTTTAHGLGASAFHPDAFFALAAHVHSAADITSGTLDVARGGTGTGTAFTAGSIVFAGAGGVYSQDNAKLFYDSATGNFGIGTSAPSLARLQVSNAAANTDAFAIKSSTNKLLCEFYETPLSDGSFYIKDHTEADKVLLSSVGSSYFTGGNLGIGTTGPGNLLTLLKNQNAATILSVTNSIALGNVNATAQLQLNSVDSSGFIGAFPSDFTNSRLQDRVCVGANSDASGFVFYAPTTGQDIRFFAGALTESVRMTSAGVGIGTTSPGSLVDILGAQPGITNTVKGLLNAYTNNTQAIDTGGSITLGGNITGTSAARNFAGIVGRKENGTSANEAGYLALLTNNGGTLTEAVRITSGQLFGIGITPTARLHLKAGSATANTAPLKFTSGTVLTTAEAGAIEFTTDDFFATITTGAARKAFVLDDGARLTSGKIPRASTNGRLIDGPTPLAGTKVYYVADASGGAVTRKLTFTDGILVSET